METEMYLLNPEPNAIQMEQVISALDYTMSKLFAIWGNAVCLTKKLSRCFNQIEISSRKFSSYVNKASLTSL